MKTELPFNLEGIGGDLKIVYNLLSFKLYQNANEIKRNGKFKPTYTVSTQDGGSELIRVLNNPLKGYMVEHRGQRVKLQESLSPIETIFAFIPLVIFCAGIFLFGGLLGLIGGALIGASIALSLILTCNILRQVKGVALQLLISVVIGFCTYLLYYLLGLLFHALFSSAIYSIM